MSINRRRYSRHNSLCQKLGIRDMYSAFKKKVLTMDVGRVFEVQKNPNSHYLLIFTLGHNFRKQLRFWNIRLKGFLHCIWWITSKEPRQWFNLQNEPLFKVLVLGLTLTLTLSVVGLRSSWLDWSWFCLNILKIIVHSIQIGKISQNKCKPFDALNKKWLEF